MSDVLTRVKAVVASDEPIAVAQVFDKKEENEEIEELVVQQLATPKVIKQNNPGTPTMGFTMEILGQEFGSAMEKAMQMAGITSVEASVFGIFDEIGIVPKSFEVKVDPYINKKFYILKNVNRMTEIYKKLAKAIGSSNSEVISFPYTVSSKITLPLKYNRTKEAFDEVEISVESLYLTPKEIDKLDYAFIQAVQYCERLPHQEGSIDLIAFKIDREEWKAMPYRT